MHDLIRSNGPVRVREIHGDQYSLEISLPSEADGRVSRACVDEACSPGVFKVKQGTGITEGHVRAFCPYCRSEGAPGDFATLEQRRYAKDLVTREALEGVGRMVKSALNLDSSGKRKFGGGLISMEMSLKTPPRRHVRLPAEDQIRRDLICPHCGLDHTVFGLARWCPDCGEEIFLAHVEAEFDVLRKMLADLDRREEALGARVALKDLENCLEDVVSIFEAAMRQITRQRLKTSSIDEQGIDRRMRQIGNAYQSVDRAVEAFRANFAEDLLSTCTDEEQAQLRSVFEKRHPIAHNLGVIDRKYLSRVQVADREGREVLVTQDELLGAITIVLKIFGHVTPRTHGVI